MKKTNLIKKIIVLTLFIFYMYALIKIILFKFSPIDFVFLLSQVQENISNPIRVINRLLMGNFIPFKSIIGNITGLTVHDAVNLFGNIVAFMPFGMFLILLCKNKEISFKSVLIISFGLSLCLECFQAFFFIGSFDVDDLILNTLGGMLGCGVIKSFHRAANVKIKQF